MFFKVTLSGATATTMNFFLNFLKFFILNQQSFLQVVTKSWYLDGGFTILVPVLSTLGEAGTSDDFICGAVWVSGAMAAVFETGGLASKLVVEAGVVGFDSLPNEWDDVDGAGFRLCLFLHNVSLEVSTK